ncbi:MAG: cytidylate kinase [Pirellulaceae bacterium]|nr:MAG: cytidylate kinase [Pirellulaceae bacterium]
MIVTIDGPAGAGKSSAARALARRLDFQFLDTGAMYRAVTWWALDRGWPLDRPDELARLATQLAVDWQQERVLVNGQDVTAHIRLPAVTDAIHYIADHPRIRAHLVELQRRWACNRNVVTEGRDQGTVVFPQAECKIFLTASLDERVRRRLEQYERQGVAVAREAVQQELLRRDQQDTSRPVGALRQADDAVVVVTDGLSLDEVVNHLEWLVRSCGERARREVPHEGSSPLPTSDRDSVSGETLP